VAIQRWFADQCDGEWEHSHGITIGTVDNPGWSIEIDLDETSLSDRELNRPHSPDRRGRPVVDRE